MSKPQNCLLGDLIEFQRGYDLPKSKFVHGKYPVQSSNGILGYHHEYKVKAPSITIGRSGTVGIPHLIKTNFFPHNTALFVKDFKGNDVEYIYYLLKNLKLNEYKTGSGVPTMNRNHLHPLKIQAFLGIPTQKSIVHILSTLDQKIAINNQINAQLEQMAKTLYDYWFVQFDFPDENGKPYKSSSGEMVYNDTLKREIPKGWEICEIQECLDKVPNTTKIPNKEILQNGLYPVIDQSREYICGFTNDDKSVITPKDAHIIFGDHTRIVKLVNFPYSRGADGTQVLISNTIQIPNYLLYQIIKDIDLSSYGYARHFKFLKEQKIIKPIKDISQGYQIIVSLLFEQIKKLQKQNQQLTQLRGFLLPMLMNGQVGVGDD